MKLLSYLSQQQPAIGVVIEDNIVNVTRAIAGITTLKQAIAHNSFDELLSIAKTKEPEIAMEEAIFLPVIPDPNKIVCVGLNYEAHRIETGRPKVKYPTIFTRFADTQVGHHQSLIQPHVSTQLDYEGELAIIIGKEGRYIAPDAAMDYIAGYSCYNDATVRDWQYHTSQFVPGKNFPNTGGFGPCMVTTDEMGDLSSCQLETYLNDVLMQSTSFSDMLFSVADLISYISNFTYLHPGDVICTGTPSSVGHMCEPPVFLQAGDEVRVSITHIGSLVNSVQAEVTML